MLMWLNDRSQSVADFARSFLLGYGGMGNDIFGNPKSFTSSGLWTVYAGADVAKFIGSPSMQVNCSEHVLKAPA